MPKLLKLCTIKNLMRHFPRQNYSIYKHILKAYAPSISTNTFSCNKPELYFSTLSSPEDATEIEVRQLSSEFPNPKKIVSQVLNEALLLDQTLNIQPSISFEQFRYDDGHNFLWRAILHMEWPESFDIEGTANRKTDAENIAFLYACQKLKEFGVLDQDVRASLSKDKFSFSDTNVNQAKTHLLNIYQRIWVRYGKKEYIPKFNATSLDAFGGSKIWKSELHLSYPENKVFEATASRLRAADAIAAAKALQWLTTQGVINKNKQMVLYSKEEEKRLRDLQRAPYSICIPQELQDKMQDVLTDLEKQKSLLSSTNFTVSEEDENEDFNVMMNIITEKPYFEPTEAEFYRRSFNLRERKRRLDASCDPEFLKIKKVKSSLPIVHKREDILKLLDENQVIILSGETGCGKSTQVPQFIFDHYIDQMKGGKCNIIVTQPRRISAVTLADRVAKERKEKVGETIGHQIRLNRCLPSGNGAILYCTTGMLLRKLFCNPNLEGVSHVIIDEVHERSIHIDFLLILLKNVLETNKSIKILLMSATFNTQLFSQYFNHCAVISVPGKIYPVKEYFLEDLVKTIPGLKPVEYKTPTLDSDLLINVINYINTTQPPGAILCFLPGWHDIRTVHAKLLSDEESASKLFICPVHSRLPYEEQKCIFIVPNNRRKVILATNVAETSITVDDVVYVVNSGLHKGTMFDIEAGISSLAVQWITKANVRQRRGRAGRVQPGVCYNLFSRKTLMKMDEYPVAEILRVTLENVILDCKLYLPKEKAENFLSRAIQPPSTSAIESGINELQIMGVLDENENLTHLGKSIVRFGIHPRLSVALVYAAFLGCLDPVLTICAILTLEKEPFVNTLDDKFKIKKIKEVYDNGYCSDHLALLQIYDEWKALSEETDISEYCQKYLLDDLSLQRIKSLKELFAEDLYNARIVKDFKLIWDMSSEYNINRSHIPSILATLTAAFFPNVIKIIQGEISHGKLNKESIIYSIVKEQKAHIQRESVVSEVVELPSPWLVYFSAMKSEARRLAMVSSLSSVPGICLLLLAGRDVTLSSHEDKEEQDIGVLHIDDYKKLQFSCSEKEGKLLLDWRECMRDIFKLYLRTLRSRHTEEHEYMLFCRNKFIETTKEILETPQVPFTKGHVYEFVNNNLVVQDL